MQWRCHYALMALNRAYRQTLTLNDLEPVNLSVTVPFLVTFTGNH